MPVTQRFKIERFIAADATDDELRRRFALEDVLVREYDPDAETLPHDKRLHLARNNARASDVVWVARASNERLVAIAWLVRTRSRGRSPMIGARACAALIGVHPHFRGRGLAKVLLRTIADYADRQGFEVIESIWKTEATRGFTGHLRGPTSAPRDGHRLRIADVPHARLQQWIGNARQRATGASIEVYDGSLPEDITDEYLRVWAHLQSFDPMPIIDRRLDTIAARWRVQEQLGRSSSERWLSLVARHHNGQIMALLEAIFSPRAPKVLLVRVCGVLPRYNGLGLRKWLQAELLMRITSHVPTVEYLAYRQTPHASRAIARLATDPRAPDIADIVGVKDLLRRLG
jgi:GNAT superfamily N-acetyltransferase